jgi:DNA-binding NarL/FixJ family response regulator
MDVLDGNAAPAPTAAVHDRTVVVAGAAMHGAPDSAPDALLIDLERVVESDPLRLCRETARRSPATAIIGFGPEDRLADGFQLLRLGAVSWVTGTPSGSADTIAATLRGEAVVAPRHAAWILADFASLSARAPGPDPRFNPTLTEREVLDRLAKGQTPEEVAAIHDVDTHLVNRHVRLALNRLQRHRR